MKIVKVLNNNVVIADGGAGEVVAMGSGLGFQKKKGDIIAKDRIEKYFTLADGGLYEEFSRLMEDIDPAALRLSEQIISEAERILPGIQLGESLHISLCDHINGVIRRQAEGITLDNAVWTEICRIYPDEFRLGQYAVELMNDSFGYSLGNGEAAFIAVHFINAQGGGAGESGKTAKLINDISEMVRAYFKIEPDTSGVSYYRFISHIKSFAGAVLGGVFSEEDSGLYGFVSERHPEACRCAEQINKMIQIKYKGRITKDDTAYLALYIDRLVR